MGNDPGQVIYDDASPSVREAVRPLLGLDNVELLAPTTVAVAGANVAGPTARLAHNGFKAMLVLLKLTDAQTDADDTLDVFIDVSIDDGAVWVNMIHFTQILGNGANVLNLAAVAILDIASDQFDATADLAASGVRAFLGKTMRVRHTVVDPTGANVSFTFSVVASFK